MTQTQLSVPVVMVTGAAGFIGGAVVRALIDDGIPVIAASRKRGVAYPGAETKTVEHYADLDPPDGAVVIHLAGDAQVAAVDRRGAAQIEAEHATVSAICAGRAARIVYASSGLVYGDASPHPHRCDETLPAGAPYAELKKAGERIVAESGGVVARLSNVYGPGMAANNLFGDILAQIPGTGPLRIRNGTPKRDFLWVADAARGLVAMALGTATGIFNLASGTLHSAHDIARAALSVSGESGREIVETARDERPSIIAMEIGETMRAFGWRPRTTLEDAMGLLLRMER